MPKDLMKYECLRCGWIYDPAEGDPDSGIKPGTPFKDIPNSWKSRYAAHRNPISHHIRKTDNFKKVDRHAVDFLRYLIIFA